MLRWLLGSDDKADLCDRWRAFLALPVKVNGKDHWPAPVPSLEPVKRPERAS